MGELSPAEALARLQEQPWNHRIFSAGYTDSPYWLYFTIPRSAFAQGDRWLRLAPNYLDHVSLYFREAGTDAAWAVRKTGDLTLPPRGDLDYRFPVFVLPEPSREAYEVLLRVQSSSTTLLDATLWEPAELASKSLRSDSFWGFYFGLASLSTALVLYLALLYRSRLLWSVFSFSVSYLVVASIQGYVDWLFPWPQLHLQHYLTGTSILLSYPTLIWMASETIGLRDHFPRMYRLMIAMALVLLLPLVSIPLDMYGLGITAQALVYLPMAVTMVGCAAVILWRERFKLSTVMLSIGPFTVIAVTGIALTSTFDLIEFNANLYLSWQYLLLVNTFLVMGIALSRILQQRKEQLHSQRLAQALKVEQEARFHQRQFMGMVSHEFRTPLSVLYATLQNLRYSGMEASAREARYGKMERALDRLTQLSDNCLADARLSADALYPEYQDTCLHHLIHSAATIVSLSERHQLSVTIQGEVVRDLSVPGPRVSMDPALMRIALANVMDNAVKYSDGGLVQVDCQTVDGALVISVVDEGPGVPVSEAPHIFERYRQAEAGDQGRSGVGLGLFIARQIAEAHDGELLLAANGPEGCRFEFVLPGAVAGRSRSVGSRVTRGLPGAE